MNLSTFAVHIDYSFVCLFVDKGWPVVLLDVDSKQSESALRGPPPTFVTEDFLKALRSIIHSKGMYVHIEYIEVCLFYLNYIHTP